VGWVSSTKPDSSLFGLSESAWKLYKERNKLHKQFFRDSKLLQKGKKLAEFELNVAHTELPYSSELSEVIHEFFQE